MTIDHTQLQPGDVLILRDGTRRTFAAICEQRCCIQAFLPNESPYLWHLDGIHRAKPAWDIVAVERDGRIVQGDAANPATWGEPRTVNGLLTEQANETKEAPAADEAGPINYTCLCGNMVALGAGPTGFALGNQAYHWQCAAVRGIPRPLTKEQKEIIDLRARLAAAEAEKDDIRQRYQDVSRLGAVEAAMGEIGGGT